MQHLRGRIAKSDVRTTYVRTYVRTYLRIQHCVSALRCRDKKTTVPDSQGQPSSNTHVLCSLGMGGGGGGLVQQCSHPTHALARSLLRLTTMPFAYITPSNTSGEYISSANRFTWLSVQGSPSWDPLEEHYRGRFGSLRPGNKGTTSLLPHTKQSQHLTLGPWDWGSLVPRPRCAPSLTNLRNNN